jgi:hypothetical protein
MMTPATEARTTIFLAAEAKAKAAAKPPRATVIVPIGIIIVIVGSKPGVGSEVPTKSIVQELDDYGIAAGRVSDEDFHTEPSSCALCATQGRDIALCRSCPESIEVVALTRTVIAATKGGAGSSGRIPLARTGVASWYCRATTSWA